MVFKNDSEDNIISSRICIDDAKFCDKGRNVCLWLCCHILLVLCIVWYRMDHYASTVEPDDYICGVGSWDVFSVVCGSVGADVNR